MCVAGMAQWLELIISNKDIQTYGVLDPFNALPLTEAASGCSFNEGGALFSLYQVSACQAA